MKFKIRKASYSYFTVIKEIEINTLEELMAFIEEVDEEIIIDKDKTILIYDDLIE